MSHSKTGYCRRNRGHFVVFNAQIFSRLGRILKQVDLDLTLDADRLTEAARMADHNLYVFREDNPNFAARLAEKPISAVLREAVWWTKIHPRDEDRFLPLAAGPIWKKPVPLRCSKGAWQGQPAYSVDFWSNTEWESLRNYSGAAVQLMGSPPRDWRVEENAESFDDAVISATGGRPLRPIFYHRTGALDYVWFNQGAAVPALLYDRTLRVLGPLSFTIHRGNTAIHLWKAGKFTGLIWPCGISAEDVIKKAHEQLSGFTTKSAESENTKT